MRRTLSVLTAVALALGGLGVLAAAPAAAASARAGTYVALSTQSRVVDTYTGAGGNRKGALGAGRTITARVAGVGRVPRSGVGSVVVTVTASTPTGSGGLVLYGAHRPATTNLRFAARQSPVTTTAVVPLSNGRIHIRNTATRGSVQVAVDVSGYYRAGNASATDPGVFHVLPTARRVVSVQPHAHATVAAAIGGHGGVPSGAGAAAVTLTVVGGASSGAILAHRPDEPQQTLELVRFAARQQVSGFAVVRLSGGKADFVNTSARTIRLYVDVAGWCTIGFAQTAGAFQTVVATRAVRTSLGAGQSAAVKLAGRGGVPLSGVAAVLVTLHATSPKRSGGLQAWKAGVRRPKTTTVLQFRAGRTATNVALVPLSVAGRIAVRNTSSGRTGLTVDVDGYVPATTVTPPAAARGRYLSDLTGNLLTDTNAMSHNGCVDAQTGSSFVLLDVGAQTVTAPLSSANPGVALAKTAGPVRYSYSDLESLMTAYLGQFKACMRTASAEIAIGTSNDGAWDPKGANYYAPDARGRDWASFIDVVTGSAPAGLTISGASDMEPQFAGSMVQALAWKSNYLAGSSTRRFVFNGSADGCPVSWTTRGRCDRGWTASGLYSLAGGSRTRALPQVYFGAMATQWAMIDATGGGAIRFVGALQQPTVSGSLSAARSWVALDRAVSSVSRTPVPRTVVSLLG